MRLLQVPIWKKAAGFVLLISSVANIATCEEFKNLSMNELLEAVDSSLSSSEEEPQNQKSLVKLLQTELNRLGCGAGIVDGVMGKKTQRAIEKFKNASNLKQNIGYTELLQILQRTSKVECVEAQSKPTINFASMPKLIGTYDLRVNCDGVERKHWLHINPKTNYAHEPADTQFRFQVENRGKGYYDLCRGLFCQWRFNGRIKKFRSSTVSFWFEVDAYASKNNPASTKFNGRYSFREDGAYLSGKDGNDCELVAKRQ